MRAGRDIFKLRTEKKADEFVLPADEFEGLQDVQGHTERSNVGSSRSYDL